MCERRYDITSILGAIMILSEIIKNFDTKVIGDNVQVKNLCHNSKEVTKGDMFFCLTGGVVDGHMFAKEAEANGASVIVAERELDVNCTQVIVNSTRAAMAVFASNYFSNPSKDLIIVGVTGTNGKTTTTYILQSIVTAAGKNAAIIGTNGVIYNGEIINTFATTPDPILLQSLLLNLKQKGAEVVIMEMSAHAAYYQKLRGVMTDIILFTNLSQDHLDFFITMENYGESKRKLFDKNFADYAVINFDDAFGISLAKETNLPYLSYSINKKDCDIKAEKIEQTTTSINYTCCFQNKKFEVSQNLIGTFNISNGLCAIGGALLLGCTEEHIKSGLANLKSVPGRFNTKIVNDILFVIDYAHTPDGLENILRATRPLAKNKLISVFGCGGNRDNSKRHIMGEISGRLADLTIITSDNSRLEDPNAIISDIESGISGRYIKQADRKQAIKLAFKLAGSGDCIVISGKGAEDYIDCGGKKTSYSDAEVIKEIEDEYQF